MDEQPDLSGSPLKNGPSVGYQNRFTVAFGFKLIVLATVNATSLWTLGKLIPEGVWLGVAFVVVATIALDVVYLTKAQWAIPFKYLLPGTIFLLVFQLYPVLYTAFISTTNLGTGNILDKDEAIAQVVATSRRSTASNTSFDAVAARNDAGDLALILTPVEASSETTAPQVLIGTTDSLEEVQEEDVRRSEAGKVTEATGYTALKLGDVADIQEELLAIEVPYDRDGNTGVVTLQSFTKAALVEFALAYDAGADTMINVETGEVYSPDAGYFVSDSGQRLSPGWQANIGFSNFERVFSSSAVRGPFFRVFVWNWAFAVGTVLFSFIVGLGLALVLDHPKLGGKRIYRSLLIFPWALPSVLTVLVWEGMLNQRFGIINALLGLDVGWLDTPWMARASVLFVSTWLSFPYFFVVCTGALQSIPKELVDAANVDGASNRQAFSRVTFPLLLITVAPLLISSFAFNFNNFNVVFFLTRGGPPVLGAQTPAGSTDILVSYTYQLAFASGRGQDFAFATAISILIFLHVAFFSAWGFRKTARLEDI